MRKCIILFLLMAASTTTLAEPICVDKEGDLHCNAGTVESIDFLGDVKLDSTNVLEMLKTVGDFTAKNGTLNHINIVGDVDASNTVISGNSSIVGDVIAKNTRFNSAKIVGDVNCEACEFNSDAIFIGDLNVIYSSFHRSITISTYASQFHHAYLDDITVKKQSRNVEQFIYLKEGSIANNVTFTGGKGVVELSGGSMLKGKVIGGKIENKN